MPVTLIALLSLLRVAQPAPSPAIEDGVRALLSGDYQRAASVLRPLAERADADPATQFLLGILYLSPRMGAGDGLGRACGFFSAVAKSQSVFAAPSMELATDTREQLQGGAMMMCVAGPSAEYTPASFTLGPGHTVEIGASTFTVRDNGVERTMNMGPLPPGWIPLPVRYLPVDVPGPTPARRHFLVSVIWWSERPDAPSAWNLGCTISEVAGADFLPVTAAPKIVVVSGARPPDAFDVDRVARVFVNADGDVEWQTGIADTLRSGVVPKREPK